MRYTFTPNFSTVARVRPAHTIAALSEEVGVYSATPAFVRRHCGPIARAMLDAVPSGYYAEADSLGLYPNVDIRIHRLYPGDYPAYPGWHCDGEYRETYFSQPDLDRIKVSKHVIANVSSCDEGVSNTEFLTEPFTCDVVSTSSEHTLWGQVHTALAAAPRSTVATHDGELIVFDSWTLHRVMPARIRGWRMFFRMSMWHRPNLGDGGMLTKQEQVYKLVEGSGW